MSLNHAKLAHLNSKAKKNSENLRARSEFRKQRRLLIMIKDTIRLAPHEMITRNKTSDAIHTSVSNNIYLERCLRKQNKGVTQMTLTKAKNNSY